jgi:exopolysaccharide biosynthesis WecB/TagA/CpsF family protein
MCESRHILGIKVDFVSVEQVLSRIGVLLQKSPSEYGQILCTTNPEFILSAQKDEEFAKIINNSLLSVPDGIGVSYAKAYLDFLDRNLAFKNKVQDKVIKNKVQNKVVKNKVMLSLSFDYIFFLFNYCFVIIKFLLNLIFGKISFPKRVSGADLIYDICALAEERGYSVFLLGGWPTDFWGRPMENPNFDLAQEASKKLLALFPRLNIIGATSEFSYKDKDDADSICYIKEEMLHKGVIDIDILFVCYGHKSQEKWLQRNMLKIPAKLGLGLGGTFDYVTGRKKRSPKLIKKYNIEWLYRLVTQPWRIKRIFNSSVVFIYALIVNNILNRK